MVTDTDVHQIRAQEVYEAILRSANGFLHNAKFFHINLLRDANPSYEEVARIAMQLAELVRILADNTDPMLYQKSLEYASLMAEMGNAISMGDEDELKRVVDILDRKPMLWNLQS